MLTIVTLNIQLSNKINQKLKLLKKSNTNIIPPKKTFDLKILIK